MYLGNSNTVAVVDDDTDVRDVLGRLLETAGHTVKTYQSGEQFLEDPALGDVACLVVDQKMPRMTGLELLSELDRRCQTIPTVLITGVHDAEVAREARALGAIDVLSKPMELQKLLQFVAFSAR